MSLFKSKPAAAPVAYRPADDDRANPGLRAYNDNVAEARVQRRNAQIFALACLGVAVLAIFGMISASHQPKLIPYVVEVDRRSGETVNMGRAPRLDQAPSIMTPVVQYTLRQFITGVRTVTPDREFQNKLLVEYVRPFLSDNNPGTTTVNTFLQKNDPFTLDTSEIVRVDVDTPVPVSAYTYQLHWFETTESPNGMVTSKTEWTGFATIQLHQVDPSQARLNPFGIYITDLTWQQNVGLQQQQSGQSPQVQQQR